MRKGTNARRDKHGHFLPAPMECPVCHARLVKGASLLQHDPDAAPNMVPRLPRAEWRAPVLSELAPAPSEEVLRNLAEWGSPKPPKSAKSPPSADNAGHLKDLAREKKRDDRENIAFTIMILLAIAACIAVAVGSQTNWFGLQ